MAWQGWDGRVVTLEQFKAMLDKMPDVPFVQSVWLHNTDAPTIKQALATAPATRMVNLEHNYRVLLGWSGGPNIFIFPQRLIGLGTPLTKKSTHSPSANGKSWSIEMMAAFKPGVDDDDAGVGLKVKDLACQVMALLLDHRGFVVQYRKTWFLHKDDPRTTHKSCPGIDIEAPDIQARVKAYYEDLNEAGDHGAAGAVVEAGGYEAWTGVVNVLGDDWLNFRDTSGVKGRVTGKLPRGTKLTVIGEAQNGATTWLRVRTPMGYEGWVSAKYVLKPVMVVTQPEPTLSLPQTDDTLTVTPSGTVTVPPKPQPPLEVVLVPVIKDHNDIAMALLTGLPVDGVYWLKEITKFGFPEYRPYTVVQAAGGTGNSMRESYPRMVTTALGDKINGVYTAYGINQWRDERQAALFAFCRKIGLQADSIIAQLLYMVHELHSSERQSGDLLRKAEALIEAVAAGVSYERPAGWLWPKPQGNETKTEARSDLARVLAAARKGDGWTARISFAEQMLREYATISGKAV